MAVRSSLVHRQCTSRYLGRIFSRGGGNSGFFHVVIEIVVLGEPTVVEFHFTNTKLTEKRFSTKN